MDALLVNVEHLDIVNHIVARGIKQETLLTAMNGETLQSPVIAILQMEAIVGRG